MLINVNANSVLLEVLIKGEEEGGVSHFVLEGSGLRPRGSLAGARGEFRAAHSILIPLSGEMGERGDIHCLLGFIPYGKFLCCIISRRDSISIDV